MNDPVQRVFSFPEKIFNLELNIALNIQSTGYYADILKNLDLKILDLGKCGNSIFLKDYFIYNSMGNSPTLVFKKREISQRYGWKPMLC